MIKHKEVKGIFSFVEFSAALAKHVFLPLKILIFWFQIVAFRIFNQKLHNSYPCLEQSWHYAGDRLTFSVHTIRRRNLKTQKQSRTSHLDLCLRKTQGRDPWRVRFRSVFRSHQNAKPGLANSLGSKSIFRKNFRKAPFSWRVSVDGRPNCRNKAAFLKFLRRNVNGA